MLAQKTKPKKLFYGFTLIELLIVITIIALLMAGASASYLNSQQKGRDAKRKADLAAVRQALELFKADNGAYPDEFGSPSGAEQMDCKTDSSDSETTTGGQFAVNWGTPFTCNGKTYMNLLPKDPSGSGYEYEIYEKHQTSGGDINDPPGWCLIDYGHVVNGFSTNGDCQQYTIWTRLENPNDPDIAKTYNDPICLNSIHYASHERPFTWAYYPVGDTYYPAGLNPTGLNYCVHGP